MTTPINTFQDILDAMEQDPSLRDALRRHILTEELLQMPVRLERIEANIVALKTDVAVLKADMAEVKTNVAKLGGDVSNLRGTGYESHVAARVHRHLRRDLGITATVFSTQRHLSALTTLLDEAEISGLIDPSDTDELDLADLILTADGPTDYLLAEISVTVQQPDIHRASGRARLLAKATGKTVTPFVIGTQQEPGLNPGHVQVLIVPARRSR